MKILVKESRLKDIGELDHTVRLPTAARVMSGMKTTCQSCGLAVTDEFFVGGFKAGYPNMILHEKCVTGTVAE